VWPKSAPIVCSCSPAINFPVIKRVNENGWIATRISLCIASRRSLDSAASLGMTIRRDVTQTAISSTCLRSAPSIARGEIVASKVARHP